MRRCADEDVLVLRRLHWVVNLRSVGRDVRFGVHEHNLQSSLARPHLDQPSISMNADHQEGAGAWIVRDGRVVRLPVVAS